MTVLLGGVPNICLTDASCTVFYGFYSNPRFSIYIQKFSNMAVWLTLLQLYDDGVKVTKVQNICF